MTAPNQVHLASSTCEPEPPGARVALAWSEMPAAGIAVDLNQAL